ncbi:MAG: LysR family transcriptional regulator [Oscillospiraceae bacterium]|nr:LysR family transcriptional regulator [Oscillospiraceae bacterium]
MDLMQLQYFREVARRGHVTQAAAQLHITQPALSKTISNMENELGIKLFDRDGKRIRLNAYGQVVLRYADQIFSSLEQMNTEISDLSSGVSGSMRIAVSIPNRKPDTIFDELERFIKEFPGVCVSYLFTSAKAIREGLLSGNLDLGVTSSSIICREIVWTKLYEERMGIILSRNHPLAQKTEVCMADLEDEWFFCNNAGNDTTDLTYEFCRLAGFQPKVRFEGFAPQFIGERISSGAGVSFMVENKFRQQYTRDMEMGVLPWAENITFRRVTEPYCVRDCGLVYAKDRYLPQATRLLCQRLIERFQ